MNQDVRIPRLRRSATALAALAVAVVLALPGGCPPAPPTDGDGTGSGTPVFNNTTDPTNDGATYIGSAACSACHPEVAQKQALHAHKHALTGVQGQPPEYPAEATRAGVPTPPGGRAWTEISYVISGYLHGAFFVDGDGFVLTDGVAHVDTGWQLDFPANGTLASFFSYLPQQTTPLPYDFETCFRCHTTGPLPQDPDNPQSQDGRPGILGTWAEAGVQCEACHGPGSRHAPHPDKRNIYVNAEAAICGQCHSSGDDPDVIPAVGGFIGTNTEYQQLRASGGHSEFACTVCHDPHASITYDRSVGVRNACTVCHADMNLAFHDDAVFRLGDYIENVRCESCHMPLAGVAVSTASAGLVGPDARVGDVRAHIFRINTEASDASAFLTGDGTAVRTDAQGRAALTVDYVCLRCHNEGGNVFPLTRAGALLIAQQMHAKAGE